MLSTLLILTLKYQLLNTRSTVSNAGMWLSVNVVNYFLFRERASRLNVWNDFLDFIWYFSKYVFQIVLLILILFWAWLNTLSDTFSRDILYSKPVNSTPWDLGILIGKITQRNLSTKSPERAWWLTGWNNLWADGTYIIIWFSLKALTFKGWRMWCLNQQK